MRQPQGYCLVLEQAVNYHAGREKHHETKDIYNY